MDSSEAWIEIDLFIAPDGDFHLVDEHNRHLWGIEKPILPEPSSTVDFAEVFDGPRYTMKRFSRYKIKVPSTFECREALDGVAQHWPTAWRRFIRIAIEELEAKDDAPWKGEDR